MQGIERHKRIATKELVVDTSAKVAGKPVVACNPATAITAPTGGGTVDTQSRTAITAIIAALQAAGITL